MENVISDMGDGLAIGNCILDNEISGGREQSELLEEYGMSQFNLLKKYMEYGAFDRNGESLFKEYVGFCGNKASVGFGFHLWYSGGIYL